MGSLLKYRYSGEDVVEKSGSFVDFSGQSGFLITNFIGDKKYIFQEQKCEPDVHFRSTNPIVVDHAKYLESASLFLSEIQTQKLGKAVFSRVKKVDFEKEKCNSFFDALCQQYPNAFVYLISDPHLGTWIGASPEILIHSNGDRYCTMSLAGTLPINTTQNWTEKEEKEQQLVTDFVVEMLKKHNANNLQISPRFEKMAGPVKHLCNEISFDLSSNDLFNLAFDLHPTPAVSGLPRNNALDLINKFENHDRLLYTGIIGEQNRLYVNLRCCEIQEGSAFLYLGGGFTSQSDPQKEWEETENKSLTLINVINSL